MSQHRISGQESRFKWLKKHAVEGIGVIVVGLYTIVSNCTFHEIQETNRINREALVSVQRAFINPQAFLSIPITSPSRKIITDWQFYFPWENSGATPTQHAITHSSFLLFDSAISDGFPFPDLGSARNTPLVLGPKATLTSAPLQIPVTILKSISPTGPHLYFWGWLAYNDTFTQTKRHVTEVCRELTQIIGDFSNPNQQVQWIFTLCEHYNCVDDECKDYEAAVQKR